MSVIVEHMDAASALALVGDGAHIVAGPGCGAPTTLLRAVNKQAPGRGWTLDSGMLLGDYPFLDVVRSGDLRYRTWHVMAPVRELVADGVVGYVPIRASRVAGLLAAHGVGAALVRVTPPDRHGYCSLGPSAGYGLDALRLAGMRIGEVDPDLPRTHGGTTVHRSVFDALVETEDPTPRYESAKPDAISKQIAAHILGLLPRDPTLQIGIGSIPEAVVSSLATADVGRVRFAGMATDEMVDLFERGIIAPEVDESPITSPELMGTERLMRFADGNPAVSVYPSSRAHDAALLGRIERFVSINTAIEVDLSGQVNSEMIRGRQVSGVGGSLDFVDAASRSPGGLRVIALPAATANGVHPKIVGAIGASGTVTMPRSMVDAVVTEYGVAVLEGLTSVERSEALIAISHPQHRAALTEYAGAQR
ncbi:Succinyl-CoA:coenzyme A transferase [Nocardia cerradoensis]|uniref:Succinyl-CoA:coenzyme A transferase n=1 Tax=Nocardia cerradoensis TaxID=85688 RepID=A0A231HDS9_9NOCA|nr:acetyl-CoA hydrolase/transferase C-terminal domain-containing protein [Nocardia cerradoensis]OXR46982.1 Succinyl-CoA:coenzyme A transferase [Nocardia cerradoensis]